MPLVAPMPSSSTGRLIRHTAAAGTRESTGGGAVLVRREERT